MRNRKYTDAMMRKSVIKMDVIRRHDARLLGGKGDGEREG